MRWCTSRRPRRSAPALRRPPGAGSATFRSTAIAAGKPNAIPNRRLPEMVPGSPSGSSRLASRTTPAPKVCSGVRRTVVCTPAEMP